MQRDVLLAYLEALLQVSQFKDYAPNGLQVAGSETVNKVVTGVTASLDLIEAAIEAGADTLLVHHGYFWKNERQTITAYKQKRIQKLLAHQINLLAYHLPLDAHPELGNNAQLAKLWQIEDLGEPGSLLRIGQLDAAVSMAEFMQRVTQTLKRKPLHLPGGPQLIQKVAWCSGGAQHYIEQAAEMGADLYISGEVSEQTTHLAKELGIHYLAAGHHATERYGVKALGEHLQQKFGVDTQFIDIDNPV